MGVRIPVTLMKCDRCGKRYGNPLFHECVSARGGPARPRIAPRVAVDCPKCHRPVTNPLMHVCVIRTDFKKRLAAQKKRVQAQKRAKARAARPRHDYHSCRDQDCQRRACVAYREGFEEGVQNCPLAHM